MKYFALVIAVGLLAGCHDDLASPRSEANTDAVGLTAEATARAQIAIDDAMHRIVPALDTGDGMGAIESALSELQSALEAANGDVVPALADAARKQVDRYARSSEADHAELDAVRLAINLAVIEQ